MIALMQLMKSASTVEGREVTIFLRFTFERNISSKSINNKYYVIHAIIWYLPIVLLESNQIINNINSIIWYYFYLNDITSCCTLAIYEYIVFVGVDICNMILTYHVSWMNDMILCWTVSIYVVHAIIWYLPIVLLESNQIINDINSIIWY